MKITNIQDYFNRRKNEKILRTQAFSYPPDEIYKPYEGLESEAAYEYDGHRYRVRKRIEKEGLERLRVREVVEYILYHTIPRQDVNRAAAMIVDRFGTVNALLNASREDLSELEIWEGAADFLYDLITHIKVIDPQDTSRAQRLNNFLETMYQARWMKQAYPGECCAVACTDVCGNMIYHAKLGNGRRWAEYPASGELLESIVSSRAQGIIIMLFTDQDHLEFTDYERLHAPQYMHMFKSMNCVLLDIICANGHGAISIRRTNILDGAPVVPRLKMVCEEYQASMDAFFANRTNSVHGGNNASTEPV